MTNKEIKSNKQNLAEINKKVNKETSNVKERLGSLIVGIKNLQDLADVVCAKKYLGIDIETIEEELEKTNLDNSHEPYFRNKIVLYEEVYKEISHNIYYALHTEEMFNACVSAKWSCSWASIAAIASCISVLLVLFFG